MRSSLRAATSGDRPSMPLRSPLVAFSKESAQEGRVHAFAACQSVQPLDSGPGGDLASLISNFRGLISLSACPLTDLPELSR